MYWAALEWPFDWEHGVETAGIASAQDLEIESSASWGYMGTPPWEIHRALRALGIGFVGYSFVDVGSGKGRVALIASRYGFDRVVAIELSAELHETSSRNIEAWRRRFREAAPISAIHGSALEVPLPANPLIVYAYNPLKADGMRVLLQNLATSYHQDPRRILFLYRNPTCLALLDDHPQFVRRPISRLPGSIVAYEVTA